MQLIFFSNCAQTSNSTLTLFYLTVPLTVEESDVFTPRCQEAETKVAFDKYNISLKSYALCYISVQSWGSA